MLIGAVIGLVYSKQEEREVVNIFENQNLSLLGEFIQPFRMHQNGKVHIKQSANMYVYDGENSFKVYLTDLYANMDISYSYGPRYLESNNLGTFEKTLDLKIGEYNLVFEKTPSDNNIEIVYSISLRYLYEPNSKYTDWALAFIDIGVSMLLVGLTIYLGI